MKNALNSYVIRGLNHNGEFLQDLYRHPRFVAGDLSESRWLFFFVLFLFRSATGALTTFFLFFPFVFRY